MGDARAHGAFPRMLRRFARKAPQPYRTALKMAAEEIEELRVACGRLAAQAQASTQGSWDRDCRAHHEQSKRRR